MLEVIVKVFTDHGYDAATLELIAKRLGLSKSAVYHHFDSKSAMLELALEQVLGAHRPGADGGGDVLGGQQQLLGDPVADRLELGHR